MKLKELLGNDHPLFSANIAAMEKATGNAGVDTRLIADITHAAHDVMRALHLDPADTTGQELYRAVEASARTGQAEQLLNNCDYVLVNLGDGVISLNLQDVIENSHHELSYEQRRVDHAQRHLRMEIVKRYAEHDRTSDTMVKRLAGEIDVHRESDRDHAAQPINEPSSKPYLLAIGDIFTDAFIKLREDKARIDTDPDGSKRLSMPFGSKPPYERVDIVQAVGPSPNAAVSFARLGLDAGLMAYLGNDKPGTDSLEYLHKESVDTRTISVQDGIASNYYYVLRYGADRTILVKNEEYRYDFQTPTRVPDWIYLSLISESAWQLHEELLAYLEAHPDTKLAFQPGTFHFEWGVEKLRYIYERSYIIVLNREEAVDITGKSYDSLRDLAAGLHELGPEVVVITDGPNGSYASYDGKMITVPNYPDPAPPLDRTGAGDAFASTIVAALAHGETIETALKWAPINSMNVVQKLGAQAGLLHREDIEEYLKTAPEDYRAKELE